MPEFLGNIEIPEITPTSGGFPVVTDYEHGRAHAPKIVVHRFGPLAANAKIEQRYLLGGGAKRFTVRKEVLDPTERKSLEAWWLQNQGAVGAFTYSAPNEDGSFTDFICRFEDQALEFDYFCGCLSSTGVTLVEIPQTTPTYSISATVERFDTISTLETDLARQAQEIFILVKIQPREAGYPAIYISDRRATVGGQLYQPRILSWDGIEQGMSGETDLASFDLGNADHVMTYLANDVDLLQADIEFALFHVPTGTKINLWKGLVTDWTGSADPVFHLRAQDGLYELTLPYPPRRISRTCWKAFNVEVSGCPWADESNQTFTERTFNDGKNSDGSIRTRTYEFTPDAAVCDKGFLTPNGCVAHGMEKRFGGLFVQPQSVLTKDYSQSGFLKLGRPSPLTSASMVNDTIYGRVLPEIYCRVTNDDQAVGFPVNAMIAEFRDEGDFAAAIGIIGEGPIADFTSPRRTEFIRTDGSISLPTNPHTLDGQNFHGWDSPANDNYGLRLGSITGTPGCHGGDPETGSDRIGGTILDQDADGDQNNTALGEGGAGVQVYRPSKAAGTAFAEIRRSDAKGLQPSNLQEHNMVISIRQGLGGWIWTESGREWMPGLYNPIWIAVNLILRAMRVHLADAATQEALLDIESAKIAAAVCDQEVTRLIGSEASTTETQFTFNGLLAEQKPLRDWLQEVLNCCLGYYTFAFGKIRFGIRVNSSVRAAFSDGNTLWRSLSFAPLKPSFNHLTGTFADEEYGFAGNTVEVYDIDHAVMVGRAGAPQFQKSTIAYPGVSTKSQCARLVATRLREELGGIQPETWKYARTIRFKTTILALNTEPGMVCSLENIDLPTYPATLPGSVDPQIARDQYLEFRCLRWRLNQDFSVDIEGRSTHNEIYDLIVGPKPADVFADPIPTEDLRPAAWRFRASTEQDGRLKLDRFAVGRGSNGVRTGYFDIYYADESTNRYGTIVGDCTKEATTFTYSGMPPVEGEWLAADAELMEVVRVTPESAMSNFGTVEVRRGVLGTEARPHMRVNATILAKDADFPNLLTVETGLKLRPGAAVVVNDTTLPPFDQQQVNFYDIATGELIVNTPLPTGDVGEAIYQDVRLWKVRVRREKIEFAPGFFRSQNQARFEQLVDLPSAGVVLVRGVLESNRGLRSLPVDLYALTTREMAPIRARDTAWPHRIRTLGEQTLQFLLTDVAGGSSADIGDSLLTEQQTFAEAYALRTTGVIPTPPAISSVATTVLQTKGSIILSGTCDATVVLSLRVSAIKDAPVTTSDHGAVSMIFPAWVAFDHPEAQDSLGDFQLDLVALSIADWLNADPAFASYFIAEALNEGGSPAVNKVLIYDRIGTGGQLVSETNGPLTATTGGFASQLGVRIGRRYAIAWSGTGFRSELSPLSPSTGPTGDATRIEISGIPASTDPRVDTVEIYALADGYDPASVQAPNPVAYLVAGVANGELSASDEFPEDELALQTPYGGAIQPASDGVLTIRVRRNDGDWFDLFLPADESKSNHVHGFAMDPVAEGDRVTVDAENEGGSTGVVVLLR